MGQIVGNEGGMKKRENAESQVWDAVILGGGIAGLGVARALVLKKKKVLVLEKPLKGMSSSHASGILDPFVDLDFRPEILRLTIPALQAYGRWIKQIEKATGQSTGYEEKPLLYAAFTRKDETLLKRFLNIRGVRARMDVRWLNPDSVLKCEPSIDPKVKGGLYLPDVARVLPAKLMLALRKWLMQQGVVFKVCGAQPQLMIRENRAVGIKLGSRSFRAGQVVGCLGAWAQMESQKSGFYQPVQAVRGQLLIYKRKKPLRVLLHTADGGYLIPWSNGRVLAGSTVEKNKFSAKLSGSGIQKIHRYAARLLPELANVKPEKGWAGIRPRSLSGSPRIGKTALSGYYVANGYYRCGILIAVYVGELLAQLMLSNRVPQKLRPFAVN